MCEEVCVCGGGGRCTEMNTYSYNICVMCAHRGTQVLVYLLTLRTHTHVQIPFIPNSPCAQYLQTNTRPNS